jgi:DNA-directed RNA polymerase specialized sigma24 family protein
MSDEKHGWFPATAWSKVAKAKDPSHPEFRESVNWLIGTYWRPVYRYLLVSKKFSGDPEDMTHDFICHFLETSEDDQGKNSDEPGQLCTLGDANASRRVNPGQAGDWVRNADPNRGKFRSFLLTVLKRFVYDKTKRARRQKAFDDAIKPLSVDVALMPEARATPEEAFNEQWRREVLANTRRSLESYYRGKDESLSYEVFARYTFVDKANQPSQDELAGKFGMSPESVKTILRKVRRRYQQLIRQEVRDQVGSDEALEEELREFMLTDHR